MATATTSEAGRAVASNLHARRMAEAREAREQASAELERQRARRADTTTPLGAMMPTETLPEPPALFEEQEQQALDESIIMLRTQISYRGRAIWIEAKGLTLDSFCDLLDKRLGVAQ